MSHILEEFINSRSCRVIVYGLLGVYFVSFINTKNILHTESGSSPLSAQFTLLNSAALLGSSVLEFLFALRGGNHLPEYTSGYYHFTLTLIWSTILASAIICGMLLLNQDRQPFKTTLIV